MLAARPVDALAILNDQTFGDEVDAVMWRTIAKTDSYDFVGARKDALTAEGVLSSYPTWVQQKFLFAGIRAAFETADAPMAQRYLKLLDFAQLSPEDVTLYQLFQARLAESQGQTQAALDGYGQVIAADVRPTRAEAVYRTLLLLMQTNKIDLAKATDTLSAEAMLWRGNPLEIDMEKLLAELYFAHKDYRLGFETAKAASEHSPESRPVSELTDEAETQFSDLFLNGAADQLKDLDALSLYYDFRQLTPPGAKGDEMIRNLAARLVKVDLLGQAADLLQYQIDSRLKGPAQAQVAADLALIRIADRQPELALRALNQTRMTNLPPILDRERRILEARALIDADRADLALDLISQISGRDADLLRVDGYWKSKNYVAASNLIETTYSDDPSEVLTRQWSHEHCQGRRWPGVGQRHAGPGAAARQVLAAAGGFTAVADVRLSHQPDGFAGWNGIQDGRQGGLGDRLDNGLPQFVQADLSGRSGARAGQGQRQRAELIAAIRRRSCG